MKSIIIAALISVPCTATCTDLPNDTLVTDSVTDIQRLTENDYTEVAQELGIEVAAIKAVVEIEAGSRHEGFYAPGRPLVNFDLSMFRQFAKKNGINLSRYTGSHKEVFNKPDVARHGSRQAAQHARLEKAKDIDYSTAIQGTFWGMFQIGGFNWKLCGCESIEEFEQKMSTSEREQLKLFAQFIRNTGMAKYLKQKNWSAFALRYNGKSYASRGYHTRMANAYRKYKK